MDAKIMGPLRHHIASHSEGIRGNNAESHWCIQKEIKRICVITNRHLRVDGVGRFDGDI